MNLTKEERQEIKLAVQDLEKESSGELVLYIAKNSSNYNSIVWMISAFLGFLTSLILFSTSLMLDFSIEFSNFFISFSILISIVFGYVLGFVSLKIRFAFVGKKYLCDKVMAKASKVFLEKEVFKTIDRTGILIYISILEKRVVVLGDSGINAVVKKEEWQSVVNHIVDGVKEKNISKGILRAIMDCKKLLLEKKLYIKPNDTNELDDQITIET